MTEPDMYHQLPLPSPATSIRLVRIEPGWPGDQLQVHLFVIADRKTAPPYEALSYVWGKESCIEPILCNGAPRTVTANLASALGALRLLPAIGDLAQHGVEVMDEAHVLHSSKRPWRGFARNRYEAEAIESRRAKDDSYNTSGLLVWIDALCINQDDLGECAEQVKGMRDIYHAAQSVRIWLGTRLVTSDGSPPLLPEMKTTRVDRMLNRVRLAECGHMPVVLSFLTQALRNEARLNATREPHQPLFRAFGFPPHEAPEWSILAAFFEQPWFHRVWIVQEVAMAQKATIILGDWEVEWEPFARAVDVLRCSRMDIPCSMRGGFFRWSMKELHWKGLSLHSAHYLGHIRQCLPNRKNNLLDLLCNGRQRNATKLADYIFAMLGMADEVLDFDPHLLCSGWNAQALLRLVTIDYTKPSTHVFRDATRFIILTQATLLPLTLVEYADEQATADRPSWVPSWAQPPRSPPFWLGLDARGIFNAGFGQKTRIEASEHSNELCVSGFAFDKVQAMSVEMKNIWQTVINAPSSSSWHYPPQEEEINFVSSAWGLFQSMKSAGAWPRQSRNATLNDFIYTLCANQFGELESGRADATDAVARSATIWLEYFIPGFPRMSSFLSKAWQVLQMGHDYAAPGLLFQSLLLKTSVERRFFLTSSGYMGIGPFSIKEGDQVVVFPGLELPLVLRPSPRDAGKHVVVGPCYVHGIMDGEVITEFGDKSLQLFTLL